MYATEENEKVMERHGNDLESAIQAQSKYPFGYGSDFRPQNKLVNFFGLHPCWPRMKSIPPNVSVWMLEDFNEGNQRHDL